MACTLGPFQSKPGLLVGFALVCIGFTGGKLLACPLPLWLIPSLHLPQITLFASVLYGGNVLPPIMGLVMVGNGTPHLAAALVSVLALKAKVVCQLGSS